MGGVSGAIRTPLVAPRVLRNAGSCRGGLTPIGDSVRARGTHTPTEGTPLCVGPHTRRSGLSFREMSSNRVSPLSEHAVTSSQFFCL